MERMSAGRTSLASSSSLARRHRSIRFVMPCERDAMRATPARIAIVVILLVQVIWFVMPSTGSHPLGPKAREAAVAYAENPSEAPRAKLDVALQEDSAARDLRFGGLAALVLVLDGIGVYCFWNHGNRKAMA